ncbi:MAG TPA: hypothetical protein VGQ16_02570 [Vicinamibacterales bacterium]|jgi:hypothetical protein|nr:hypothetical protein [Vicinamibacterales bacterium]
MVAALFLTLQLSAAIDGHQSIGLGRRRRIQSGVRARRGVFVHFRRTNGTLRFSPRPKSIKAVRKFTYQGMFDTTSDLLARPGLVRGLKNRAFVVKINRLLRF